MKKVKAYLIYGIIGILCLIAAAGFILDNSRKATPYQASASAGTPGSSTPTASTQAKEGQATEAAAQTTAAAEESAPAQRPAIVRNPEEPVVGIAQGEDYAKTTRQAIENAGGMADIIQKGDTVLIKPNICGFSVPGSPIITDYRVVEEIAAMARELGAARILVAEGPISGTAFSKSDKGNGYQNLKDVEFLEINNLGKEDCYEVKAENSLTGETFYIPKAYMDADVVISVPKLKTHFQPEAVVSLCLKNLYGVPPGKIYGAGYKNGLHLMGLKESIVDLNKIRKPDFQVLEGIVGGEGYGPLNNKPVKSGVIMAGVDPVAIDTVALTFMGFTVDKVPHVKLAAEEGIGVSDLARIKVVGADLDKIKMSFKPAF